jgi:hypothetical protein
MSQSEDRISITATPEQASEFIQRLATDDEFRQRYETDTRALFAEYGIEIPASLVPERTMAPPPEVISEIVRQIREVSGFESFFFFPCIFFFFIGVARGSSPADFFLGFQPPKD